MRYWLIAAIEKMWILLEYHLDMTSERSAYRDGLQTGYWGRYIRISQKNRNYWGYPLRK